ncbi:hypothetical protein ARSEF1564_005771 [Beauveria bassiana]
MSDHTYRQNGDREELAAPPFSIRLLDQHAVASQKGHDGLLALLPASYRTESGDLAAACQHVTAYVEEKEPMWRRRSLCGGEGAYVEEKELDLQRLTSIRGWLWVAGLPLPPRALHHQLSLGREIFVTERMDMHLVWTAGRMFL